MHQGALRWHVYGVVLIATLTVLVEVLARPEIVVGSCTVLGGGKPPNTLAEYALDQFSNLDFWDISLVDGFNIPMTFTPTNPSGGKCHAIHCTSNINGECPCPLRVPGGCNNPCTTFGGQQYCCTQGPYGPTNFSRFFKQRCPNGYSYPQDDPTSLFTCPSGSTNYRVLFCP